MALDIQYTTGRDNAMDSTNNYATTTGATSKVARCVMADYKLIGGVPMGNRARLELRRETDSTTNRELLKRYILDAIKPLEDSREIKDVEITIDDPVGARGVAVLLTFTDVRAGDTATLGIIAPWAVE